MSAAAVDGAPGTLSIIYDGDCPFCANFVKFYAIRESIGSVELINARDKPALVRQLRSKGMEINDGIVVVWQGCHYSGAEGMYLMSLIGAERGMFGRLNRLMFRKRRVAAWVYPLLVAGRRLTLWALQRKPVS